MKAKSTFLFTAFACLLWGSVCAADELAPEAKQHFDAGVAYVDDPSGSKWADALKAFKAAYAISPNWKLMNNIGLCALQLERDGEAIEAYKEYLSHGGEKDFSKKQRQQMEKDIKMLSIGLVKVSLEAEPPDAIVIDERNNEKGDLVRNEYPLKGGNANLGIHPGLHKVTLRAPGYVDASWSFNAEPGSAHTHQFKLEPEKKPDTTSAPLATTTANEPEQYKLEPKKPESRNTPTAVYVGLAATGVFAGVATATGIIALNKDKDFDNATDASAKDDIKQSGRTFVLLTDIAIGAAVLSAGATAYFYFTAPKAEQVKGKVEPSLGKRFANVQLSPFAAPSAAGLAVSGKF